MPPKIFVSGKPDETPPERVKDLRVTAASPICAACGGTGRVPGTTNSTHCAACYGLGRTGARLPEDMIEGT